MTPLLAGAVVVSALLCLLLVILATRLTVAHRERDALRSANRLLVSRHRALTRDRRVYRALWRSHRIELDRQHRINAVLARRILLDAARRMLCESTGAGR